MPGWQDFTSLSQQFLSADLLLSDLSGILNPSLTYLPVIEHGIAALSISLTAQVAGEITVKVTDASGIVPTWSQRQAAAGFGSVLQFMVPYSYTTISALNIQVTSSVNQVHNCPTFIIGYGAPPNGSQGNQLVRPDGRDYPIGQNSAQANVGGATASTLVAAPGAGLHLLLYSTGIQSATNFAAHIGTIGGTSTSFHGLGGPGGGSTFVTWPGGLLLDANTALTFATGAAADLSVIYDVVT